MITPADGRLHRVGPMGRLVHATSCNALMAAYAVSQKGASLVVVREGKGPPSKANA